MVKLESMFSGPAMGPTALRLCDNVGRLLEDSYVEMNLVVSKNTNGPRTLANGGVSDRRISALISSG